jgi:hypothetical protein
MESLMSAAVLIEATMLSILLSLWITWIGLRGLFRLMPGANVAAVPIRFGASGVRRPQVTMPLSAGR